jgi:hypothetical protein
MNSEIEIAMYFLILNSNARHSHLFKSPLGDLGVKIENRKKLYKKEFHYFYQFIKVVIIPR